MCALLPAAPRGAAWGLLSPCLVTDASPIPGPTLAPTAAAAGAGAGQVAAVWRERLSLLLESTGEGIFGIDMADCCVFVNRSAAQMLGWPADAIIGRNMQEPGSGSSPAQTLRASALARCCVDLADSPNG